MFRGPKFVSELKRLTCTKPGKVDLGVQPSDADSHSSSRNSSSSSLFKLQSSKDGERSYKERSKSPLASKPIEPTVDASPFELQVDDLTDMTEEKSMVAADTLTPSKYWNDKQEVHRSSSSAVNSTTSIHSVEISSSSDSDEDVSIEIVRLNSSEFVHRNGYFCQKSVSLDFQVI